MISLAKVLLGSKSLDSRVIAFIIVLCTFTYNVFSVKGEQVTYLINETQSFLSVVPSQYSGSVITSGTVFSNTIGIVHQGSDTESLTTSLGGTLIAEAVGNQLTFSGGSNIDALPHPSAPFSPVQDAGMASLQDNFGGNLGFMAFGTFNVDSQVALRDTIADITTGSVVLGQTSQNLKFELTSGFIDTNSNFADTPRTFLPPTLQSVFNESTEGSAGSVLNQISIPFFISFDFEANNPNDSTIVLEGLIIADRSPTTSADFNSDGFVNETDLTQWQGDFGINGDSDADGDLDSDGADFLAWQRAFDGAGVTASFVVPEPSSRSLGLFLLTIAGMTLSPYRSLRRTSAA